MFTFVNAGATDVVTTPIQDAAIENVAGCLNDCGAVCDAVVLIVGCCKFFLVLLLVLLVLYAVDIFEVGSLVTAADSVVTLGTVGKGTEVVLL